MSNRSIPILLLVFAFLLGAWGNVIAAAFCPRYLSNRACYEKPVSLEPKQVKPQASCHHDMGDIEMVDMQMDESEMKSDVENSDRTNVDDHELQANTETTNQQIEIDLPAEPCGHCWMHSQPASGTATLVAVDPAKPPVDSNAPPADSSIALPNVFTVSIAPLEHGPPGNALPRHVLINVFRI